MRVLNRDGQEVEISYDAIRDYLRALSSDLANIDIDRVVIATITGFQDGITTSKLDEMSASLCANMQHLHYEYDILAGRILASNCHKNVRRTMRQAGYDNVSFTNKVRYMARHAPAMFNDHFLAFVSKHAAAIDAAMDYSRDYKHTYFAMKTLQNSYVAKLPDGSSIETPADMWMRVACAVHAQTDDIDLAMKTYNYMSQGFCTHASPTLFNAGLAFEQNSSCFLLGVDDSLDGIFKKLNECALISKHAGGIGLHVSNIRGRGTLIKSNNGRADGLVPMLQVFNAAGRYCNQSGRRKGSIAVYLEPWHTDIFEFLELRLPIGAETERARDLFLALWVPDEFMQRVVDNQDWYLMSPEACPGLVDAYGEDFSRLYQTYIDQGRYTRKTSARKVWQHALKSMIETGTPYMLMKCTANRRSNQQNLGTIKGSNLCAEIIEYSDASTTAVCNLASIAVSRFWDSNAFNYSELHAVSKLLVVNLNNIIDANYYPSEHARHSNLRNRPIGIGIQGVGDLLNAMDLSYGSPDAMALEASLMECIYHGALEASAELAQRDGSYETFAGSPFSQGVLQFDMGYKDVQFSGRYDWDEMRNKVKLGMRNSLLTALMPTASTSLILGNTEAFEPYHSNVYTRGTLSGTFMCVNRNLQKKLCEMGLWTARIQEQIIRANGSIGDIHEIPEHIRAVYRTVWDLKQKCIIDHAMARAPFVDQSQSMNIFYATPSMDKLSSALIYGWQQGHGLKTCCYYLRSQPAKDAIRAADYGRSATVASGPAPAEQKKPDNDVCTIGGGCMSCSG